MRSTYGNLHFYIHFYVFYLYCYFLKSLINGYDANGYQSTYYSLNYFILTSPAFYFIGFSLL